MLEKKASQVVTPPETSRAQQSVSTTRLSSMKRPSTNMDPPRAKVFVMQPNKNRKPTRFESAVEKLHSIAQLTDSDTEDEYDKFGQHIASQLRQLPLRSFIVLQSKFQTLITQERLAALNDNSEPQSLSSYTTEVNSPSLLTSASDSTSNNEFENVYSNVDPSQNTYLDQEEHQSSFDVLSQALVNICPIDDDSNME